MLKTIILLVFLSLTSLTASGVAQTMVSICQQSCANAQGQIIFALPDKSCPNKAQENYSCAPFACDDEGKTCRLNCLDNRFCAKGFICNKQSGQCFRPANTCSDELTSIAAEGASKSCFPYKCAMGNCLGTCKGNDECWPGHECIIEQHRCSQE